MEIVLSTKRKLSFVLGTLARHADDRVKGDQWNACNNLVISWIKTLFQIQLLNQYYTSNRPLLFGKTWKNDLLLVIVPENTNSIEICIT